MKITPQDQKLLTEWLEIEPELNQIDIIPALSLAASSQLTTQFDFYIAWQLISEASRYLNQAGQRALTHRINYLKGETQCCGISFRSQTIFKLHYGKYFSAKGN